MKSRQLLTASLALPALLMFAFGGLASAEIVTFDNTAGDSLWQEPTNWSTDLLPGALDDAVVPRAGGIPVDVGAVVGTINSLQVGGGGDNQRIEIEAGTLVVSGDVLLGLLEGTDNRGGELRTNNNSAVMTVNGNIVANSSHNANDIRINRGILELAGDVVMTGDNRIDELDFERGTFDLIGVGPQTLTVEQFDMSLAGGSRTTSLTLGAGKTLITTNSGDTNDLARSTNTAAGNRNNIATLDIFGGSATFAGVLRVGSVQNGGTRSEAHGTINVGNPAGAETGTLIANNGLRLALANDDNTDGDSTTGDVVVSNAGSTVTVAGDIRMAEVDPNAVATITINDGLFQQTSGNISNGPGSAVIDLLGGTLDLATTDSTARAVDTFNFSGGQLKLLVYPDIPSLMTTDTALAAGLAGSVIDLAANPDSAASTTEQAVWDGGAAAWDGDATKWNPDILPAELVSIQPNDEFTIISSVNAIANQGNAALSGASVVDWGLDQTSATEIKVKRTGAAIPIGPGVAVIDNAASIVSRASDLSIQAAAGQGADASQLGISDGSLTLTGGSNLIIGGVAQGIVNQDGGAVTLDGILQFGPAVGDQGGQYNLNSGTLTINGVDGNGNSIAETDVTVNQAQVQINGGTLSVAGNILSQRFSVGQEATSDGASYTIAAGKTVQTTGTTAVGANGTNAELNVQGALIALNIYNADATGASATMNIDGGTVQVTGGEFQVASAAGASGTINITGNPTITVTGGNFEVAEAGTGVFNMDSGTLFQNSNNFIWGQGSASDATMTLTGGTIDLRGDAGQNMGGDSGHFRVNRGEGGDGVNTADLLGGAVIIGAHGDLSMTNNNNGVGVLTIDGAEVTVGDDVEYRGNGTDTILLKSGLLDLTTRDGNDGADADAGQFRMGDRSGTNEFIWTGGTLTDVSTFIGNLVQDSTDDVSLLLIGDGAGIMDVAAGSAGNHAGDLGDYTLAAGGNGAMLEIELFAQDVNAGVDFDLLNVAGTATLAGFVHVFDRSGGAIDTTTAFTWNVVEADEIDLTAPLLFPVGFFYQVIDDFGGGGTDVLQISTVPEPGTVVLLAVAGLFGLLALRRRKS